MALLRQIDLTKPITIYGQRYERITHNGLESLAAKLDQPNLVVCAENVAGTTITLSSEDGDVLLAVLVASACGHIAGDWYKRFERNLQCLSQDAAGHPLLTTWVALEDFEQFLQSAHFELFTRLQVQIQGWRELGVEEVCLDGYERAAQ